MLTVRTCVPGRLKVAVTFWDWFRVTMQVSAVPEQAPLQPPKVKGAVGLAVSVTVEFNAKSKTQVEPQLMPAGWLVTVPVPLVVTVRV